MADTSFKQSRGHRYFNPLTPRDAVRKQKNLSLRAFLVQHCQNLKNITRLEA